MGAKIWAFPNILVKKTIKDKQDEIATGSWHTIPHVVFTGWLVSCCPILFSMHTSSTGNDTLIRSAASCSNVATYHLLVNDWLNLIDQPTRCWFVCLWAVVFQNRKPTPRPLTPVVLALLFPEHLEAGKYCHFSVSSLIGAQLTFIESMMSSQDSRNLIRHVGLYLNYISVFPPVLQISRLSQLELKSISQKDKLLIIA